MFGGSSFNPAQQETVAWLTGEGVGDGSDILADIWSQHDEIVTVLPSMVMHTPFPSTLPPAATPITTLPPLPSFGFSGASGAAAAEVDEQVSSNEAFTRAAGKSPLPAGGLRPFHQLKTSTCFESPLIPPHPLVPSQTPHNRPPTFFPSTSFPSPSRSEATATASVSVSFDAEAETRSHGSACHPLKRKTREEPSPHTGLQVLITDEDSSEVKPTAERGRRRRGRRRAAEVHNLSERRRRERINDKMKALQELIPNSNKMDKASMLDEAIEYMKVLQSQLKMLCMMVHSNVIVPPMMDPMAYACAWTNTHHGLGFEGTLLPTSVYTPSLHAEGSDAQQGTTTSTNLYPQVLYPQVHNCYMTPSPHLQHQEHHYNMHQTNNHATQ